MAAMTLDLILLAAAVAASPATDSGRSAGYGGVRAEGRVTVQIVAGARIAASEVQHPALPPLQDSIVRTADGSLTAARLVEFQ